MACFVPVKGPFCKQIWRQKPQSADWAIRFFGRREVCARLGYSHVMYDVHAPPSLLLLPLLPAAAAVAYADFNIAIFHSGPFATNIVEVATVHCPTSPARREFLMILLSRNALLSSAVLYPSWPSPAAYPDHRNSSTIVQPTAFSIVSHRRSSATRLRFCRGRQRWQRRGVELQQR